MRKTLIYHLYVNDGFETNLANRLHRACLERYSHAFDEVRFTIAVDDLKNYKLISDAIGWVISIGFGCVSKFTVVQNGDLREVDTFDREILKNKENLDGAVFFGHNKGSTNIVKDGKVNMNVFFWICSMYFYNLEFVDEVEGFFTGKLRAPEVFYGAVLLHFTKERTNWVHAMPNNISGLEYAGTFYWINIPKWKNCLKMGIIKDVEADSRFFAEEYPGMFFERYAYGCGMTSHNDAIMEATEFNPYFGDWEKMIGLMGDVEGFKTFVENNLKRLSI